jgi:release factor glutamine methyltransferase
MTINEAYKKTLYRLYEHYNDSEAENIANLIIEEVTHQSKLDRIMFPSIPLNKEQQLQIENIVVAVEKNIPIQYVLEKAWFMGLPFYVNNHVLIPRSETEELVDWIVQENAPIHLNIIDIGTGSGCIAISLKKKLHHSNITALDISLEALAVATKNSKKLNAEINCIQLDFLEENNNKSLPIFNVIVSNPPYIALHEKTAMHERVVQNEPNIALFVPNNNTLIFYNAIAKFGLTHLENTGAIYVEINEALGKETQELFTQLGYCTLLKKDMQQKDRMLKAWLPPNH